MDLVVRRAVLRHPPRISQAPRPGGGVRTMVVLEPGDEAVYRVSSGTTADVERSLGPAVVANRVAAAPLELDDWRAARARRRLAIA